MTDNNRYNDEADARLATSDLGYKPSIERDRRRDPRATLPAPPRS